jgi:putative flippase GtrA
MNHRSLDSQAVRFLITGCGAALLQFGVTAALIDMGMKPGYASGGAYLVALVAAYAAHRAWTFRSVQLSVRRSALRYLLVQLLSAATAALTASAVSTLAGSASTIALVSTVASSTLSFVLSSQWAFRPAQSSNAVSAPLQELS